MFVLAAFAFACGNGDDDGIEATPTAPAAGTPSPEGPTEPPPEARDAVQAARRDLAGRIGEEALEIDVVSVEAADWPDACLGLPREDELCAQVITAGYRVVLGDAEGVFYLYRTDARGGAVRFETMAVNGG